jgi:sirohydrochlorin cobaltochelatase
MSAKALVAASFGTSHRDAIESCIAPCEKALAAAFPDYSLVRAFSSSIVRRILAERDGLFVPSPEEAYRALAEEGSAVILVQSLLMIPGEEYEKKIVAPLRCLGGSFAKLSIGRPLLPGAGARLASVLEDFRARRDAGADLVLMGHGSRHEADVFYAGLQRLVDAAGFPIHLGTVEGSLGLDAVLARLETAAVGGRGRRFILAPFMLVAGDHVRSDMAGPGPESWLARLGTAGYAVEPSLEGLGSHEAVQDLFVESARSAATAFSAPGYDRLMSI